jgi:hypothetical protein
MMELHASALPHSARAKMGRAVSSDMELQKNDFSVFSVRVFALRYQSLLHSNPNSQRQTGFCGIPSSSFPPS